MAVLTQPDRPAGRGRRLAASPVKAAALAAGLPVLQPPTLRDPAIQATLRDLAPDLLVVVAYGLLLPRAVLGIPPRGCVNIHASLLPRWRGASPVQSAILAGDPETGVCLMALDEGMDTGPVYLRRSTPIGPEETAGELESRLAGLGADALAEILPGLLAGTLVPVPQSADGVTRAAKISKADGQIDWSLPARELHRRVRAYNPWPGAETLLDGERLRCFAARVVPAAGSGHPPGQVVACGPGGIDVQTGEGLLRLLELQLPGRQRMPAAAFLQGHPLEGRRLG